MKTEALVIKLAFLAILIALVAIGILTSAARPARDCGRMTLEQVKSAGIDVRTCRYMPQNRNGG